MGNLCCLHVRGNYIYQIAVGKANLVNDNRGPRPRFYDDVAAVRRNYPGPLKSGVQIIGGKDISLWRRLLAHVPTAPVGRLSDGEWSAESRGQLAALTFSIFHSADQLIPIGALLATHGEHYTGAHDA